MITIISGTNRKDSLTRVFAEKYYKIISNEAQQKTNFLTLEDLPSDWFSAQLYKGEEVPESLIEIQEKYIFPSESFIVFSPEYNGSFPGVLKMFIDACSVRQYASNFNNKKVGLVGVAAGRAGNLRGMGHLASVFNHMGAITFPRQLPFSNAEGLLDEQGKLSDPATIKVMTRHAQGFILFST